MLKGFKRWQFSNLRALSRGESADDATWIIRITIDAPVSNVPLNILSADNADKPLFLTVEKAYAIYAGNRETIWYVVNA
jgi:hypothetical protein